MTPLQIDIRHKRLRGGRMTISAGTDKKRVRERAEQDIRMLIERGEWDAIERLRSGSLSLGDVRAAVRTGEWEKLRESVGESPRMGPALDRLLTSVEGRGVEGTSKEYRTLRTLLLAHFGPDRELASITVDDARAWLLEPKAGRWANGARKPWSVGRQNTIVALVGRLWNEEITRERDAAELTGTLPRLTKNPWTIKRLAIARVQPTRFEFLKPEEWRTLIESVRGTPQAAALALGALAGLRLNEAAHLRTSVDVDLEHGRVRVQGRKGAHPWRPKYPRSVRDVPMGTELRSILEEHIELGYAGERYFLVLPYRDQPVSPPTIAKWTRESFEAVGLQYGRKKDALTYHSLRHTFASWLVQQDVQLMKVAKLLGDRADMVEKIYGHLMPQDLERAIGVLDAIARGGL